MATKKKKGKNLPLTIIFGISISGVVAIILVGLFSVVLWRKTKNQQQTVGVADRSRLHDYLLPYIIGDEERIEGMIWQPDSSVVGAPPQQPDSSVVGAPPHGILPHDDMGDEERLGDIICQPDSSEDAITFDKVVE